MRVIFILLLTLICTASFGQINEGSVLTNESISERCKELKKDKVKMLNIKQRLSALLERNGRLNLKTEKKQKNLRKNITTIQGNLDREFALIKERIDNLNENLIRKGCQGINF